MEAAPATAQEQRETVYTKAKAESGAEQAAIFEAHATMLEDPHLLGKVREAIEAGISAEAAMHEAAESYAQVLEGMDDEYRTARRPTSETWPNG